MSWLLWLLGRRRPPEPRVFEPGSPFPADQAWDCNHCSLDSGLLCCRSLGHLGPHAAAVGLGQPDGPFVMATWPPFRELDPREAARRLGLGRW